MLIMLQFYDRQLIAGNLNYHHYNYGGLLLLLLLLWLLYVLSIHHKNHSTQSPSNVQLEVTLQNPHPHNAQQL